MRPGRQDERLRAEVIVHNRAPPLEQPTHFEPELA
jgi:hypothetical protein